MDTKKLTDLLKRLSQTPGIHIDNEDLELLRAATVEYPYFAPPFVELALREGHVNSEIRMKAALMGAGHPEFRNTVERGEWLNFYPPEEKPRQFNTEETIDEFLNTYGKITPEEEEILNKMIFNPVPDYGELLAREKEEPHDLDETTNDPQDAILSAFLESHSKQEAKDVVSEDSVEKIVEVMPPPFNPADFMVTPPPFVPDEPLVEVSDVVQAEKKDISSIPAKAKNPPSPHDNSLLSESLAKIYVRQGRYERAYEIISAINLKFPKKSVYFADQLRFLEKLIANEQAKRQAENSENV